jgi:hypothetical protein
LAKAPIPERPLEFIRDCLFRHEIRWTYHVTMRLKQRSLGSEILVRGAGSLEVIESYPDDKYLPSFLLRGEWDAIVFHVLMAADVRQGTSEW